jgi:nitrogen fixation NifU-like protein
MSEGLYNDALMRLAAEAKGAGRLTDPDATVTLDNPMCGDRIALDIKLGHGVIQALAHEVRACALCQAAASAIAINAIGKDANSLKQIAGEVTRMLKADGETPEWPQLAAFRPVIRYKSRHACVELPFRALVAALDKSG